MVRVSGQWSVVRVRVGDVLDRVEREAVEERVVAQGRERVVPAEHDILGVGDLEGGLGLR